MDQQLEWWALCREPRKRELVVGALPVYPTRMAIIRAHQHALGLRMVTKNDVDADGVPTGSQTETMELAEEPDGDDPVAVAYAILGACWQQPAVKLPTFRECKRDVIEYGERVQTALLEQGYLTDGLVEESAKVLGIMQRSVFQMMGLIEDEEAGFDTAQEQV
jgi:hypothetical protein